MSSAKKTNKKNKQTKKQSNESSAGYVPPDSLNDHILSLSARLLQSFMETLALVDMFVLFLA